VISVRLFGEELSRRYDFQNGFSAALNDNSSKFRNGGLVFDPFSEPNSSISEFRNLAKMRHNGTKHAANNDLAKTIDRDKLARNDDESR
jgi:hypothetical protein